MAVIGRNRAFVLGALFLAGTAASTSAQDAKVASSDLDKVAGRYDYRRAILTVTREGDGLFAQMTGQPKFEIVPKGGLTFAWTVTEAEITFVKDDKGAVTKAVHKQGGRTIEAPKLGDAPKAAAVDPKAFDAVLGRYDYGNGLILTVTREGDRLFGQATNQPKFEMFPASETEYFWTAVNAQLKLTKDASGKVTGGVHTQSGQTVEVRKIE